MLCPSLTAGSAMESSQKKGGSTKARMRGDALCTRMKTHERAHTKVEVMRGPGESEVTRFRSVEASFFLVSLKM